MFYIKILHLLEKIENNEIFSKNDLYVKILYNNEERVTTTNGIQLNPNGMNHLYLI